MAALYDTLGHAYAAGRKPDDRIAARVQHALGAARSVVNVGAGAGSYEPCGFALTAVEPSQVMIAQRSAGAAPCVRAGAEALPFRTDAFEAALAVLTIHHWSDWRTGLDELSRVARERLVLLTFDPDAADFWLMRDYFPELLDLDRKIMPSIAALTSHLGAAGIEPVEVPHDCSDGFLGAFWRRPEVYLDATARACMSSFARIDPGGGLERLGRDLESGAWQRRNEALLVIDELDVGYRMLTWAL